MKRKILTCVALLAGASPTGASPTGASPLAAQVVSPADSADVLLGAAQSLESDGQSDVAAALYRFIASRFDTTPAAVLARTRIATLSRLGAAGSGSVELRVWATTYGLWLGVAIPAWFGADQPEPYGVGLLAGGPVGYFGGKSLAESLSLTEGQARAVTFGGTWGTWQGLGWAEVLEIGGPTDEARFGNMVVGGLAGIATGALLARRGIQSGVASAVNYGALWGTWFGVATSVLLNIDDGDGALTAALIGGDAGLVSTALLAPGWNLTRNRARLISIAGVIGGVGGLGLDLIIQPDGDRTAVAIPLAMSIIGLAVGAVTSRNNVAASAPSDSPPGSLSGALFKLDEGDFGVGFPTPMPTFVRRDLPSGGTALEPAASFTLFAARF